MSKIKSTPPKHAVVENPPLTHKEEDMCQDEGMDILSNGDGPDPETWAEYDDFEEEREGRSDVELNGWEEGK